MTASPRPRTKPRKSIGDIAALPPEELERTPDDLYIKVYPARLRKLIRDHELTRAQLGALLILALRMDEHNECWPSKARATHDAGMNHIWHTSAMHRTLADKGVLTIDDADNQSHTFTIPDAFEFGARKTDPGGDRKTAQGGSENRSGGDRKTDPEAKANKQTHQEEESSNKTARSANADSEMLMREMIRWGVRKDAASAFIMQFRHSTIQSVLEDAKRKAEAGEITNPGGWISASIQKRAGQQVTLITRKEQEQNGNNEPRPRRPR